MITLKQFYLNELRECCYILSDESGECVIIDAGISSKSEQERIVKYISSNNLKPVKLLCTHGHFDHVMGNAFIVTTYNIPTYIHPKDKELLGVAKRTSAMFGIDVDNPPTQTIDLADGDEITFGNSSLKVICTPGHTWGSVCFYAPDENVCITGDTLFAGNCGRTDLPEGDNKAMCNSLTNILVGTIKPECNIYAGHGPNSTMKDELAHNPYLRASTWLNW